MRHMLIFLSLFSLNLFASQTFTVAFKHYKDKNYSQAYEIFNAIQFNHLGNTKFNYYFGRSAYETLKYKEALGIYERILIAHPNHQNAKYEIAKTYLKLHMYEDSISHFNQLLNNPALSKQKMQNIHYHLKQAKKQLKSHSLKASISIGIHYDDNIDNDPSTKYIYIPSRKKNIAATTKKDDVYHRERLRLTYLNDIGERGGWLTKHSVSAWNKSFIQESQENKISVNYYPSLIYKVDKYTFNVEAGVRKTFKDGHDYLNYYLGKSNITFKLQRDISLSLQGKVAKKEYQESKNHTKDSNIYSLEAKLKHKPMKNLFLTWRLGYEKEDKKRGNRLNIDATSRLGRLYAYYRLDKSMAMRFSTNFRQKHYKAYSKLFQTKREDFLWGASISLLYKFNPQWTAELVTAYSHRDSNQDIYDYQSKRIGINLLYRFGIN